MTSEQRAIAVAWTERLKARMGEFVKSKHDVRTGAAMAAAVAGESAAFMRDQPDCTMNTGITAKQYREYDATLDVMIPDDWELWCCGWRADVSNLAPDRTIQLRVEPTGRAFRPPETD